MTIGGIAAAISIDMLSSIMFYSVLGFPLVMYFGLLTLVLLLLGAFVGGQALKGRMKIQTHKILAGIALVLAIGHAIAMMIVFFPKK